LEKNTTFDSHFFTEPYEVAWAGEARFFLRVLDISGEKVTLTVNAQLSPDGLFWCDEGSRPLIIEATGLYSFPVRDFGHWLRLQGRLTGACPKVKLLIYLAVKE
jgi:hypothetical protein